MRKRANSLRLIEPSAAPTDELTERARWITEQLYHAVLSMGELMLVDSSMVKIEAYYPPRLDGDGRHHCGLDVRLADGSLFEFTLKNTGWENPSAYSSGQPQLKRKTGMAKFLRSIFAWVK